MSEVLHRLSDAPGPRVPGGGDSPELSAYARAMAGGEPYIEMTLNVDQPIELSDFVTAFTALGAEYDRFARATEHDEHATLYVSEVRPGSIKAILLPILHVLGVTGDIAGRVVALEEFVRRY